MTITERIVLDEKIEKLEDKLERLHWFIERSRTTEEEEHWERRVNEVLLEIQKVRGY